MSTTAPKGFSAAGVAAGLKSSGDLDVAVVVNHGPDDAAAAVFTTNRFPAAPVLWTRQVLAGERARAVVLNSGGANACTGPRVSRTPMPPLSTPPSNLASAPSTSPSHRPG